MRPSSNTPATQRHKPTIGALMLVVGLLALDCAVVRLGALFFDWRTLILIGFGPAIAVLNYIVIIRLIRGRWRPERAWFWRGFLVAGSIGLAWLAVPLLRDSELSRQRMMDHGLQLRYHILDPLSLNPGGPGDTVKMAIVFVVYFGSLVAVYSGTTLMMAFAGGVFARLLAGRLRASSPPGHAHEAG